MVITEEEIDKVITEVIVSISAEQSEAIAMNILLFYKAGALDVRPNRWSRQQQAVDKLQAEHFGYMSQFNNSVGEQIRGRARDILRSGGGYEEIQKDLVPYVQDVFKGKEKIIIDNRGKIRSEIRLDKYGKLYKKDIVIRNAYTTNVKAYTEMLSHTATHTAWEQGRLNEYQRMGFKKWRFAGPIKDERTRPWHAACVGNIYEYGTLESDLAMQLLCDVNCRHRAVPIFDDPELDTPMEYYDQIKADAGLYFDDEKEEWAFPKEFIQGATA